MLKYFTQYKELHDSVLKDIKNMDTEEINFYKHLGLVLKFLSVISGTCLSILSYVEAEADNKRKNIQ